MEFFEKYSFKQKNYVLAILVVLLFAVVYKHKISVLLESVNYKNELEDKILSARTADSDIRNIQLELVQLNRVLGEEGNSVEKVQQSFLNFFTRESKGLKVQQINEVLSYEHPDFEIYTHFVVLKGSYLNTLEFIYAIERKFDMAKILNAKFEYKRNSSEEEKALYTTLLIQNYSK